jgi:chromosome segregation ATPase
MKHILITTIAAVVLAFSTGCSQGEIDELNTKLSQTYRSLDDVQADLAKTKKELSDVEIEMTVAQGEAEAAKAELRNAKKKLNDAEREMNVAQDQSETAYVNLHKAQKALKTQRQRADRHEAASQGLKTKYDLKVAEYETFLAKTAETLAAKDKRISELETQLSAVRNKN